MAGPRLVRAVTSALLFAYAVSRAALACDLPSPPSVASKPTKPALPPKPACVSASGKDACPGWEAYSYNDQIKAYNVQVTAYGAAANAYVATLNAFVTATAAYAKCEVDSLR